jgi:hypothetical protein
MVYWLLDLSVVLPVTNEIINSRVPMDDSIHEISIGSRGTPVQYGLQAIAPNSRNVMA